MMHTMTRFFCLNSIFTNNQAKRGVMFIIGNVVTIKGDTLLEGSVGPALRVSNLALGLGIDGCVHSNWN